MKISEMTNAQAADALIRLSVPFGNICDDEQMVKLIDEAKGMSKLPFVQTIGKLMPKMVAYALKEHRDDMYEIIGALTDQKPEDVAKMNFLETINVFRESYDEVLKGFFTSSARQIKKTADESLPG